MELWLHAKCEGLRPGRRAFRFLLQAGSCRPAVQFGGAPGAEPPAAGRLEQGQTMTTHEQTRRDFLKTVAAAGAVSLAAPRGLDAATQRRSIGANDRIRIGIIGCGDRGIGTEMASVHEHAKAENLEVIAVYDPWRVAREAAAAKAKEWFGTDAKQCRTADELLDLRDVDAVFIASPDHLQQFSAAPGGGGQGRQARRRREADGQRDRQGGAAPSTRPRPAAR